MKAFLGYYKFKMFIWSYLVISLNLASTLAQHNDAEATIIRQTFENSVEGSYNYAFETSNNIFVEEQGIVKDPHTIVKHGQYQYTSPEGKVIRLVYTADEDGFHPQGEHLPTAPSVSYSLSNVANSKIK